MLQLTTHVYASHAELADAMLCMMWDMHDSWGVAGKSQALGDQNDSMTGVCRASCGSEQSWRAVLRGMLPHSRLRLCCACPITCSRCTMYTPHLCSAVLYALFCVNPSNFCCFSIAVLFLAKLNLLCVVTHKNDSESKRLLSVGVITVAV